MLDQTTLAQAFVALPGGGTAVYTSSGLSHYRHGDWLGTSRFASTPNRTMYYSGAYAPYGESYAESGESDRSFTGQNQDTFAGLYDFLFREYNPVHGRWISPDPAGLAAVDIANPQSWNRYAYVINDPVNSFDPLGLDGGDNEGWVPVGNGCYVYQKFAGYAFDESNNGGTLVPQYTITDSYCVGNGGSAGGTGRSGGGSVTGGGSGSGTVPANNPPQENLVDCTERLSNAASVRNLLGLKENFLSEALFGNTFGGAITTGKAVGTALGQLDMSKSGWELVKQFAPDLSMMAAERGAGKIANPVFYVAATHSKLVAFPIPLRQGAQRLLSGISGALTLRAGVDAVTSLYALGACYADGYRGW